MGLGTVKRFYLSCAAQPHASGSTSVYSNSSISTLKVYNTASLTNAFFSLQMVRLKLLTFDITNTLLKVKGSPGHQYSEVAKLSGINISPAALNGVYQTEWNQQRKEFPNYGLEQGITPRQWWSTFVKRVFISAGYEGDKKTLEDVSSALHRRFDQGTNWELLPHSKETLAALKKKDGLKLGVVSNFDERLENTLRTHKLLQYFDFLVSSVSTKYHKPDPRIYQVALDLAGVKANEAAHVGDDLINDYLAARNAGMLSFLLYTRGDLTNSRLHEVEKQFIVKSLADLEKLVEDV